MLKIWCFFFFERYIVIFWVFLLLWYAIFSKAFSMPYRHWFSMIRDATARYFIIYLRPTESSSLLWRISFAALPWALLRETYQFAVTPFFVFHIYVVLGCWAFLFYIYMLYTLLYTYIYYIHVSFSLLYAILPFYHVDTYYFYAITYSIYIRAYALISIAMVVAFLYFRIYFVFAIIYYAAAATFYMPHISYFSYKSCHAS